MFKKTPKGVLLKCLGEREAYLAVCNTHSGACGMHQAGHKMKWLLFRQGVYWLTVLKDCIEFAKGCQECEKHVGIQRVVKLKQRIQTLFPLLKGKLKGNPRIGMKFLAKPYGHVERLLKN